MTDYPEFLDNDDGVISDPTNPFYGLPVGNVNTVPDQNTGFESQVQARFGVESLGDIIIDVESVNAENLRGNRFSNLVDAIVYLHEAGILSFSDVALYEDGEIGLGVGTKYYEI